MDDLGLKIGVLISHHDAGLEWWTEDEVLHEHTTVSIHFHCFKGKGGGVFF